MRQIRPYTLLVAAISIAAPRPPAALAEQPYPPAATSAEATSSQFRADYLREVDRVRGQIASLAAAIPPESYTWRPAEGVRSVSEVYLHIAFGNYLLLRVAGYAPPADLADQLEVAKLSAWDTATTDREEVAEVLSRSFDHLRSTADGIPDAELEATVEFFGQTPTKRQLLLIVLGHLHEHLGQSIAYARINGVVPPWTAARQAAQAQEAERSEGD